MNEKVSRRKLLTGAATLAGFALVGPKTAWAENQPRDPSNPVTVPDQKPASDRTRPVWMRAPSSEPGEPGIHYKPTVTPNGSTLSWKLIDGVKVMHLVAEEIDHEFVPGTSDNGSLRARCWGYNGQVHGPTIECVEGDRLRILRYQQASCSDHCALARSDRA